MQKMFLGAGVGLSIRLLAEAILFILLLALWACLWAPAFPLP